MSTDKAKDFLYKLFLDPQFRIWRHMLLIVIFSFIAIGQSLIVFGEHVSAIRNATLCWFCAINIIGLLSLVYINFNIFARRILLKSRYVEYFLCLFAAIAVYLLIKVAIEIEILSRIGVDQKFNGVMMLDGVSNLMIYAIVIASSSVSVLLGQWMTDTQKIANLKNRQLKSSVDKLKNQINPKFLSNTIDYVTDQIKTDSKEASGVLFRLSEILRYVLYDCMRKKVLLKSDIEFIDKFLSLKRLVDKKEFTYTITVTGNANLFVAPFIFVPVVQRILEQQPAEIQLKFDIIEKAIDFECKALGADLTNCDFSEEEQRLEMLYQKEIGISKTLNSVNIHLERC